MNSSVKRNIGLVAATVMVFALGACVGSYPHHKNHITFLIRANGDVNVSPEIGDEIAWVMESVDNNGKIITPGTYVKFDDYKKKIPCEEIHESKQEIPTCTVTSVNSSYLYSCKTSGGLDCVDPHVGPGSRTSVYSHDPKEHPKGLVVLDKGNREPQIACLSSGNGYTATVDPVLNLLPTELVQWTQNPTNAVGYSFTLVDQITKQPICNEGSDFSSAKPLQFCTPGKAAATKSYTYDVKITAGQCQGQVVKNAIIAMK
jgi:hypothetical protein